MKWLPAPVFSPGKSHGQRSLMGYSSYGRKEWETTQCLQQRQLLSFPLPHKTLLIVATSLPAECPLSLPQPTAQESSLFTHLWAPAETLCVPVRWPLGDTGLSCFFFLTHTVRSSAPLHIQLHQDAVQGKNHHWPSSPPPPRHLPQTMGAVNETFSILSLVPGTEAKYSAHSPFTVQSELQSFL